MMPSSTVCSHSDNLHRLNQLRVGLSYPGWLDDFLNAKQALVTNPRDLEDLLFKLEEKQRMQNGDRSHERLVKLDSHVFSYPGWQLDNQKVEEGHVSHKSGYCFEFGLEVMVKKEKVFNGDRSGLVQLDRLKRALSYPGWEYDFIDAEQSYFIRPHDFQDSHIFKLIEKQRMFYGDRTHIRLQKLDSYAFDYPGFAIDKRLAEMDHVMHKKSPRFDQILQTMKNRQRLYDDTHRRRYVDAHALTDSKTKEAELQSSSQTSGRCVICMTEPKSHAFIPCGHLCACELCAFETFGRSGMCPICRQEADLVTQIFSS